MKRLIFLIPVILLFSIPHPIYAQEQKGRVNSPETAFNLLKDGKGMSLYLMCSDMVQNAVTIQQLNTLWGSIEEQAGKYISHGKWEAYTGIPGAIYSNISFEKQELAIRFVYDDKGKITGFQFIGKIPYKEEIQEEQADTCTIITGRWRLPARLSLPKEAGNDRSLIPLAVLVHGSGPNSMDEAIGPNFIFKEIAGSLAEKGIATLRYDKRTYIYGSRAFEDPESPTVAEETTDDAVSAVRLAWKMGFRNIFVLGHSLGAGCAPAIAAKVSDGADCKAVKGIIMLAAPARKMTDIIESQLDIISEYNTPETIRELRKTMASLPESYLAELDYDRRTAIEELSSKNIPALLLQGERDYQVTMQDLNLWRQHILESGAAEDSGIQEGRQSFGGRRFITISYPGLNHIFHKGEGKPSPAEYMQSGKIPDEVIDDISGFIRTRSN